MYKLEIKSYTKRSSPVLNIYSIYDYFHITASPPADSTNMNM